MQIFFTVLIVAVALLFIVMKVRNSIINKNFTDCSSCNQGSCSQCPLSK